MNKKNVKISYDKESQVLSVEMKKDKSVDSEIHDNVVIDYDKKGDVIRVNFYNFSFNDFKENLKKIKNWAFAYGAPILVK